MPASPFDRRKKPRRPVSAEGVLYSSAPEPLTIPCCLLDISANGFRASHGHAELAPGTEVRLRSPYTGEVLARVVWTAIVNERIESGFYMGPDEGG
jgi:hypothetical protein